jgi:hypothetical protein
MTAICIFAAGAVVEGCEELLLDESFFPQPPNTIPANVASAMKKLRFMSFLV